MVLNVEAPARVPKIDFVGARSRVAASDFQGLGLNGLSYGCGPLLHRGFLNCDRQEFIDALGRRTDWDALVQIEGCYYVRHAAPAPLPIESAVVASVHAEHFIEHVEQSAAIAWLTEVRRVMAPGGVVRLTTPDLTKYVRGYLDGDGAFYREHAEHLRACGIAVPGRRGWMMNQIFHWWGHRWLYDFDELAYVLVESGFARSGVRRMQFGESSLGFLGALDRPDRRDETLYVEAVVP